MKIVFTMLGLPIHYWLGMLLMLLIIFQILVGKKIIKIPFKWHRVNAIVILTIAIIHASIGLGLWFGFFAYV